jgi:hypothetical protein
MEFTISLIQVAERQSPGTAVPGLMIRWCGEDYLALLAPGLGAFCPRWGFEGAFVAGVAGLDPGFGPVTVRASLPVLTTGALFAATAFFSTGLAGACCWIVLTDRCSWRGAFFAGAFVSTDFVATTVGVAWGFGTPGVGDTGLVSVVTGRDGLRPRLWDGEATGVVVADEDPSFSEGRSLVEATTSGCWGFVSAETTRPAAAIAARTSARKSTTGLVEPEGLAAGVVTGGTTGVILVSTVGR